jgi:hypothetical protein
MKSSLRWAFAATTFIALLLALLTIGWRLAGFSDSLTIEQEAPKWPVNAGPMEPTLCGRQNKVSLPPPIDSPYGRHLFANTPLGVVRPLKAMSIMNRLGPSESGKSITALTPSGKMDSNTPLLRNEAALEDVQTVVMLLEEYRRAFGAMPVGESNREIVRRMQGENPLGIAVLPGTHPSISAKGELLDRWGTPYRFHPESAWVTTVRSAGPDRKMWSSDDVVDEQVMPETAQR